MLFLDLFAGIGGFRLGMEMAGHECVGHIEIDKFAHKSYMAMHKPKESEFYFDDITKITDKHIRVLQGYNIDCICGGFPCQTFSIAGDRRGFKDTRGTLFFDLAKLAKELKPRYLYLENVRGLLNHDNGDTFETLLRALDDIGYDAQWQVLNSKYHGVPQNRERVFIIGYLRGRPTMQVLPIIGDDQETTELQGQHAQKIKQVGNIATKTDSFGDNPQTGRVYDPTGISPALNTMQGGGREPKIAVPVLTPNRVKKRQNKHGVAIYQRSRGFNNGGLKDIAPTLTKNSYEHNNHVVVKSNTKAVYNGVAIRKLTPHECFRLQGFPDDFFDRARAVSSDSQLYKQAGNSVTVNVIYEIAKRFE